MKNRVLAALCAILVLLLSACGKTAQPNPEAEASASVPVPEPVVTEEPSTGETITDDVYSAEDEPETEPADEPSEAVESGEVSPELKEFLDSYEEFVDEYVEFMENYMKNPADLSLLSQYAAIMQEYAQFTEAVGKYDAGDMSPADAAYYTEVCLRCSQKLLGVLS